MFGKIQKTWMMVTVAALSAPLAYAAGNGGGYSGPNMTGSAIPVMFDREIPARALSFTESLCTIHGDSNRKIISVGDKLFQAIYGFMPSEHRLSESGLIPPGYFPTFTSNIIAGQGPWNLLKPSKRGEMEVYFDGNLKVSFDAIELKTEHPLPGFSATNMPYPVGTDGESTGYYIKDVTLWIPNDTPKEIRMINTKTGQPSNLTVNVDDYVDCLQSELQWQADHLAH